MVLFEKPGSLIPAGLRLSILGDVGTFDFREKAENSMFRRSSDNLPDLRRSDMSDDRSDKIRSELRKSAFVKRIMDDIPDIVAGDGGNGKARSDVRQYTLGQELVNNLPYIAMVCLGAAVLAVGFAGSAWGPILTCAYLVYGAAGALWIMLFVCPCCQYWNSKSCPCGYGRIAARFRAKNLVDPFDEKFKRHIPVIVPLWFYPVLAGLAVVIRSFSWTLLVLLVVFAVDAFVVLPLLSVKHGCKGCPQKKRCPWMKIKMPAWLTVHVVLVLLSLVIVAVVLVVVVLVAVVLAVLTSARAAFSAALELVAARLLF